MAHALRGPHSGKNIVRDSPGLINPVEREWNMAMSGNGFSLPSLGGGPDDHQTRPSAVVSQEGAIPFDGNSSLG